MANYNTYYAYCVLFSLLHTLSVSPLSTLSPLPPIPIPIYLSHHRSTYMITNSNVLFAFPLVFVFFVYLFEIIAEFVMRFVFDIQMKVKFLAGCVLFCLKAICCIISHCVSVHTGARNPCARN
jgi:hypothetical protein